MTLLPRTKAYLRWNAALTAEYFRPDDAQRPVYLAVDDDELTELAASAEVKRADATASFVSAVRAEASRGGDLFRSFLRERRTWRGQAAEPPYLGLLGLCVLAGSRMQTDPETGVYSNDYYGQLNPLLGRDRHGGRPPNFDELQLLWNDLAHWLDEDLDGARGRSTIRTHHVFIHIGYPISQCLLRAADRRRLPDFFNSVGLEPGAEISGERLLVLFRAWVSRGAHISGHARRAVANATGAVEETLVEMLRRELAEWDGELRDERGRQRADVVIFLERLAGGRRVDAKLYARRPDEFPPEADWLLRDGRSVRLRAATQGWYARLPLGLTSKLLRDGITLSAGKFALALEPALAIPFRASFLPEAGWVSVRQATALEEHLVLAHESIESELRAFLRRQSQDGWQIRAPSGDLPKGWLLADRVRIASSPTAVPAVLRRLVPRLNTAMRFEGGLPLARQVYLSGGEPDLWITIEEESGARVEIDEHAERLSPGIARLELSGLGLSEGAHTVAAAGETRRFSSVRTYATQQPDGAGSLAHVLERQRGYLPSEPGAIPVRPGHLPTRHVRVSGAHVDADPDDLPANPFAPVVLRRGFERYQLLGALPGQLEVVGSPPAPGWLHQLTPPPTPPPTAQFFEVSPEFRAELVIYSGKAGVIVRPAYSAALRPLRTDAGLGPESRCRERWAQAILDAVARGADVPPSVGDIWAAYVETAEREARGEAG